MVEATRKEDMSHSREDLLHWQKVYKEQVNDETLSDAERMYAFSRLTDIAAALKELEKEKEEEQSSFLAKYLKSADYARVYEDFFFHHEY